MSIECECARARPHAMVTAWTDYRLDSNQAVAAVHTISAVFSKTR